MDSRIQAGLALVDQEVHGEVCGSSCQEPTLRLVGRLKHCELQSLSPDMR